MLVLSRKAKETVHVGADVVVRVLEIDGDRVRLGFDAPRELPIHRGEVADRIAAGDPPPPRRGGAA